MDQCKRLWTEAAFDASGLLLYAEGLVTRQDLKTGLRTLLGGFEKLLKRDPALAPQIARLSALALANADAAVQEKAAKVLVAVLTATKALLSETEQADVQEVIGLYTDLLAPGARTALQAWLPESRALSVARENGSGAYCPKAEFAPTLSASSAFRPVQDWHELLFLTGQLVQHDDPMVMERWVDGLLRLQSQFPAGYAAQLQPYLVQMLPFLKGKSDAQAAAIIAAHSQSGHFGLVQALLLSWAEGLRSARVPRVNLKDAYYASDPLVRVEQHRLAAAEERLTQRIGLALLSTPSHAPHWVSPAVLVEKLLAHQAQQVLPNAADLAVALARTAFAHRGEGERALALLPQLQHAELRELLTWFLAPQEGALPLKAGVKKSLVRHLTERLGKLVSSTAITPASVEEALPWLWAVAARTKHPTGAFEPLESLTGSDYPGIVHPWQPEWAFQIKAHSATTIAFPSTYTSKVPPSPLLLYSQHVRFSGMNHADVPLFLDYPFVAALVPNNPAALHWHVLRTAGWADRLESTERDVIRHALRSLLNEGPVFAESTTRLLAVGLAHSVPECRALALEALLAAIDGQRLLPGALGTALGQLLAVEFFPIQRLADNLMQARAINAATDEAVSHVLGALLLELPSEPLRNTRKLLEAYADFASRAGAPVPEHVKAMLKTWNHTGATKKAIEVLVA